MNPASRRILVAGVVAILLAGCATAVPSSREGNATSEEGTQTPSEESASQAAQCDTPEREELTVVVRSSEHLYRATCPTDRWEVHPALEPVVSGTEVEPCQILEVSGPREEWDDNTTAFPRNNLDPWRLRDGELSVAVIPVEWSDVRSRERDPTTFTHYAGDTFAQWFEVYTRGSVSFSMTYYDTWIELSEPSENFRLSDDKQNLNQWGDTSRAGVEYFWEQALADTDPYVDYSGVDVVFFVLPREQSVSGEFNLWPPGHKEFMTDEGPIRRGFTPGQFQFRQPEGLWYFWVHESLHYFKMPDLYWVDQNGPRATQQVAASPINGYEVMTQSYQNALSMWLMWLAGWANDSEFECLTSDNFHDSSFTLTASSVPNDDLKAVLIKLSDTDVVVVESRRTQEAFDHVNPARSRDGVVVYHVDATLGHGEGALTLLAPQGRGFVESPMPGGEIPSHTLDAVMYEGNYLDIAGYRLEVNEATATGDTVSISRLPNWDPTATPTYHCVNMANRDYSQGLDLTCYLGLD